jgi:hypothetical protein
MNALLVVFAKVPEKHLEITIAADARRQYIPSFAQRRSTLSKATSKNLSKMMNKKVHSKKCVTYALKKPLISCRCYYRCYR